MQRRRSTAFVPAAVAITVAGMVVGTGLLLASSHRLIGWLLFIFSFSGWLVAALFAMREGWLGGWFDR